jgi:hypothetical protein
LTARFAAQAGLTALASIHAISELILKALFEQNKFR